jgi:hypothetical protein
VIDAETMFILQELARAFANAFARRVERGERPMPRHRDSDRRKRQEANRRARDEQGKFLRAVAAA